MTINELITRQGLKENEKLEKVYNQFERLLVELRKKELPDSIVVSINKDIEALNLVPTGDELRIITKKKQSAIIKLLEKELKVVPINYYRNIWLAVGMSAFGIPFGVALGASMGNMALLGVGLPIGMAIGLAVGAGMDKKALNEGRQLGIEIK